VFRKTGSIEEEKFFYELDRYLSYIKNEYLSGP